MERIERLVSRGRLARIGELERERYVTFFGASYLDNLEHARENAASFPRWSIISGYYAMHDITKLLLAERFGLKVEYEVHATAIRALEALAHDRELVGLLKVGYREFIALANDLARGKRERTRAQYFTGTAFSRETFRRRCDEFLAAVVTPYVARVEGMLGRERGGSR